MRVKAGRGGGRLLFPGCPDGWSSRSGKARRRLLRHARILEISSPFEGWADGAHAVVLKPRLARPVFPRR